MIAADEIARLLRAGHTDSTRLIRLHTARADVVLLAESFSGVEQVGPLASTEDCRAGFALEVKALCADAGLEAADWLGKPILVELLTQQSSTSLRPFHGHITAFERQSSDGGFGYFQLRVEPWFAFLAHRRDSYVFHDMSVPDILEALFACYQGQGALVPQWRLDLQDRSLYPKRSTCTQYDETDLAFVERLMAEEGLFYWFEHASAGTLDSATHTLVIADHNGAFTENMQARVRFHRAGATEAEDTIQTLSPAHALATHGIEIASWDYRSLDVRAASAFGAPDPAAAEMPLTRYDAPGAYVWPTREAGERYASRQVEALEAARQTLSGSGTVRTLAPGSHFTLDEHFETESPANVAPEDRNRYAALRVEHAARNNLNPSLAQGLAQQVANLVTPRLKAALPGHDDGKSTNGEEPALYTNRFTLLPAYLAYRPIAEDARGAVLRPRPAVRGAQSAIVVGENAEGQPVHTDRDGRIRVQFHWQRGSQSHSRLDHPSGSEDASGDKAAWSWVRVMQTWAGTNWGGHFVPRVGQEVLIEFIEGDVDRPVVVGALYNGQGAANAQTNQVARGAGVATGNAPAWFAGEADGTRAADAAAASPGHAHPAALAGIKTQAMSASQSGNGGFNQLVFDLTPGEPRTQLATTQFATALNLGAIRHQYDNQRLAYRAHGTELVTGESGALRAGSGMLLTTDARINAGGMQMDARLAIAQLEAAQARVTALAESAQKQQAELPGAPTADKLGAVDALAKSQTVLGATQSQGSQDSSIGGSGNAPAWREPMLVAESPAGIGALTPKDAILNAGATLSLVAADLHLAAQGKSAWAVKDGIVLYTYGKQADSQRPVTDTGLKLHAAQGKVSVQAQTDKADFNADKQVTLSSTTADVLLQGRNELQLAAAGAALQISGGNITLVAPGKVSLLGSQRNFTGPQSASEGGSLAHGSALRLNASERQMLDEQFVLRDESSGQPLVGAPYRIEDDAGTVVARGVTDREGATERVRSSRSGKLKVYWGH